MIRLTPLACVLLLLGCGAGPGRRTPRVPILVAQAEQRNIPYEIDATGTVEPIQSADVTAQVGGLVTGVGFREGDEVRAGQVLFRLDRRPFEAAAERAAAVLARDRAQAESARLDLARAEKLSEQQLIAASELDTKRATAMAALATVRADSAALVSARLDLSNATVRAPVAGKTGDLRVNLGDLVKANENATPLVSINQLRPIRVRFTVPQADLSQLRRAQGKNLRVDVASSERDSTWIEGHLAFVDNRVDPQSGTLLLKAEFDNRDGALWPGQFMRVKLRLFDQNGATVVPSAAVANSQNGPYLFVVKADTTVEARPIQVDRTYRDLTVIGSGVHPGETVVTDGQLRLSPGAKAVIRPPGGGSGGGSGGGPTSENVR
jgi:multidrug efflux system membrane fusion protein